MSQFKDFLQSLDIERELVMNFFITFSRFEYALKRAGYIHNREDAQANWEKFLKVHKSKFLADCQTNELRNAVDYLKSHPPKKQVYKQIGDKGIKKNIF